ncbi:mitochondrial translation release factor in rescue [Daktulosphaira vitifoliae]|uniref:mitochondrial translation release factor in rescue n=1 Tax=Daktulosphaira vitifoliae TaxID=58002 RepID=UPI0021AA3EB7|nr:mitochondrial translation release factor in rescue [Daktulosphaira vitifoliae]
MFLFKKIFPSISNNTREISLSLSNYKYILDQTKVPTLNENDIEEKYVKGSGPGGSAVNKNSNCVMLKHKPTGIVIKCHESRCVDENRKLARQKLIYRLDEIQNGVYSIEAQKKIIEEKKRTKKEWKRKKLNALKSDWILRENS